MSRRIEDTLEQTARALAHALALRAREVTPNQQLALLGFVAAAAAMAVQVGVSRAKLIDLVNKAFDDVSAMEPSPPESAPGRN